jgi:hypothetical protein
MRKTLVTHRTKSMYGKPRRSKTITVHGVVQRQPVRQQEADAESCAVRLEAIMKRLLSVAVLLGLAVTMSIPAAFAQGSGSFAGVTQCWINGTLTPVKGSTCPSTGSSGGSSGSNSSSGINSAAYSGLNQASYQLGYALGQWLFGSGTNPQAELQKRLMMEELRRRQAEAEQQHREEEARRLAEMYNRLSSTLKLSGLPNLQMKDIASNGPGLRLKIGDNADGQAGIKGLPGIYLNDGKVPYGIQGLPGIYAGGPGQGSGLTNSKLALKTGESNAGVAPAGNAVPVASGPNEGAQLSGAPAPNNPVLVNESGLHLKIGNGSAVPAVQATTLDPSKMTPQQLADVAEMVSKLPPEEQQRMMAAAQGASGQPLPALSAQPSAQALASPQQQAAASQSAATAPVLEDASAKARAGFDQPLGPAPVQLGATNSTPSILRPPGTAVTAPGGQAAPSTPTASSLAPPDQGMKDLEEFLFPASRSATFFPKNPNPPRTNPLREEKDLQVELKHWDEWAVQRATHIFDKPADDLYPAATERAILNTSVVKEYAPELLGRYRTDTAFRQNVDLRLQYATEHVALDYYQGLADAHKAAVLAFHAELEKLAAAGKIDKLVPLESQYLLHPERRQIVQSAWERVSAAEQTALDKAQEKGSGRLDKQYQFVFQLVRGETSEPR